MRLAVSNPRKMIFKLCIEYGQQYHDSAILEKAFIMAYFVERLTEVGVRPKGVNEALFVLV